MDRRVKYNWLEVQRFYDLGHSARECAKNFGFCMDAWTKAVKGGRITARVFVRDSAIQALLRGEARGTKSTNRGNVKSKLIREGILLNQCAECGHPPEWRGKPLVLVLDHIDGDKHNYKRNNLRLLCPHCNSQMETFAGRNVNKQKLLR